jgi:predicted nucleic acid-binding protein
VAAGGSAYVLDSFALLAYLAGEPAMARVRRVLTEAEAGECSVALSLINLGEVLSITERERGLAAAHRVLAAVDHLPVDVVDVTRAVVLAAAHIKAQFPLSYADAFAVVTARQRGAVVLTGDPEFEAAARAGLVRVEWLPRR